MPPTSTACTATRTCRWEEIQGGRVKGRVVSTKIWICEYPYRTMRRSGPGEECSDCPVYQAQRQEKERARQEEDAAHPTV